MRVIFRFGVIASFLLVSGCADMLTAMIPKTELPKNPDEFKAAVEKTPYIQKQTYEVNQSLKNIHAAWARNASKCLGRKITIQRYTTTFGAKRVQSETNITYTPSLKVDKNEIELSMQELRDTPTNAIMPEKGYYFAVVNAKQIGSNKTSLTAYNMTKPLDYARVTNAIKLWAEGKSNGCPDITAMAEGDDYQW